MKVNDQKVEFNEQHAAIPERLSLNEWAEAFKLPATLKASINFWLGDLLLYGERRFEADAIQYIGESGFSPAQLTNVMYTCQQIPAHERNPRLSYTFHQLVATVPDPEKRLELLKQAGDEDWTYRRLLDEVASHEGRARSLKPQIRIVLDPEELAKLKDLAAKDNRESAADFVIALIQTAMNEDNYLKEADLQDQGAVPLSLL